MEILVELLFQVVFEFFGEILVHLFGRGAEVLRTRKARYITSTVVGFGGGVLWGAHAVDIGQATHPKLFWFSLGFAVAGALVALYKRGRAEDFRAEHAFAFPWLWPAWRWAAFAIMSGAIAVGVATGWHPPVVG